MINSCCFYYNLNDTQILSFKVVIWLLWHDCGIFFWLYVHLHQLGFVILDFLTKILPVLCVLFVWVRIVLSRNASYGQVKYCAILYFNALFCCIVNVLYTILLSIVYIYHSPLCNHKCILLCCITPQDFLEDFYHLNLLIAPNFKIIIRYICSWI